MNTNNRVVLDFTQTNSQLDVAVMPAGIAQRALKALAEKCQMTHPEQIMQDHVRDLQELAYTGSRYSEFIAKSQDFVTERILMDNIKDENWDAYKVEHK